MTELLFRASTAQACDWLARQTATPWGLPRLLENGLTPYVWLDYDAACPDLFGEANGGYAAPIFFEGDIRRLAAGSDDVLITITKDAYKIVAQLPPPGFRRALHELRFLKKDLEKLAARLKREAAPVAPEAARESQDGISKEQVVLAFASLLKIDLEQALAGGAAIFGDDGARVKGSARKSKHKALWNPVTLALGLNDVYRVPIAHLKRTFNAHDFLSPWREQWQQTLALLGK
ncbi:hypothetical protein [Janthinobacterium agaricidamnosum]|uniref:Uncharacterized protein n=1 Tax=Janthinobacterium agaricidamnosum NBRC 102515 = DSM 9628 TaxID=1349767 RepID=W0VBD4_9BURK|nr:hypothetical protein [Janthinobacterium agaricidamnosum]CDG85191.1 putative uncharacterized protein [Janthinobacterium agaricidamnosum NBRC 102515 = DSM 9628]